MKRSSFFVVPQWAFISANCHHDTNKKIHTHRQHQRNGRSSRVGPTKMPRNACCTNHLVQKREIYFCFILDCSSTRLRFVALAVPAFVWVVPCYLYFHIHTWYSGIRLILSSIVECFLSYVAIIMNEEEQHWELALSVAPLHSCSLCCRKLSFLSSPQHWFLLFLC